MLLVGILLILCGLFYARLKAAKRRPIRSIAFFHPFTYLCSQVSVRSSRNAGGGGERVLWSAITAIRKRFPAAKLFIYTGDNALSDSQILSNAERKFNLALPSEIDFVRIHSRALLQDSCYPRLTLVGQALGSLVVAAECIARQRPDLVIDTMGCAFAYPVFTLAGCMLLAYVHYPFISSDMVRSVKNQECAVHNSEAVSKSVFLSRLKLLYYKVLAFLYGCCGRLASFALANSTWTLNHLKCIWGTSWSGDRTVSLLYPPCDLEKFLQADLVKRREQLIVSLAQFRPEKNHELQIRAFARFVKRAPAVKLVLIGGCRDWQDRDRVGSLQRLAVELGVEDSVEFKVDVPFEVVLKYLQSGMIGLHTMKDEHFGISIVEFMAAGLIAVAHDSGGPKSDIVTSPKLGFLATTAEDYASLFERILRMDDKAIVSMRKAARAYCQQKFSRSIFDRELGNVIAMLGPEMSVKS